MKKLLPILLLTSLLLSACNINGASDFELQEKCAEHSKNLFHERGYTNDHSSFSNHFNKKSNKCFILIESIDNSEWILVQKELFDAVQWKQYWYYMDSFYNWKQGLHECYVKNIDTNIDSNCETKESFQKLIKSFLEN